jgi:hypothetical protein
MAGRLTVLHERIDRDRATTPCAATNRSTSAVDFGAGAVLALLDLCYPVAAPKNSAANQQKAIVPLASEIDPSAFIVLAASSRSFAAHTRPSKPPLA